MRPTDKLILGTVQMGLPYGINNPKGKVDFNESMHVLGKAFDEGIRILDSAESYGNAHDVIGKFHSLNPTTSFKVITKIPSKVEPDQIRKKTEGYLLELGVQELEALMFHSYSSYAQSPEAVLRLVALKQEKMVRSIGVSIYTNEEFARVIDDPEIDLIQLPFNLLDNNTLRGQLIFRAKQKGKMVHTRSAFLQGLFFKNIDDNSSVVGLLKQQLQRIHDIAREEDISIQSLALSYCLAQEEIDMVLIGVDSVEHLNSNIQAASFHMTTEIIDRIEAIQIEDINLLNPSLWH